MSSRKPLIVSELASMASLELTVIAGESGLGREVRFAHISELEAPEQWLDGGELLITSGLGVPADETEQHDYVRGLFNKGAAGLAIGVRHPPLHQSTLALADDLGFPLLTVPKHVPFISITRQVVEANYGASEQLFATHLAILEMLRVRSESTTARWDLIADLELVTGYELRVVTPSGLDPHTGERHIDRRELPASSLADHDHRLLNDGVVVPVRVGDRVAAFVVARERDGSTAAGVASIRHVATVAAVEMSTLYRDRALRLEMGGRLLLQLLSKRLPPEKAEAQVAGYGLDFSTGPVLCAADLSSHTFVEVDHRLADEGIPHLLGRDELALCLLPNTSEAIELMTEAAGSTIGVSEPVFSSSNLLGARRQATWAKAHAVAQDSVGANRFVAGTTFWLPHDMDILEDVVTRVLGPIERYDEENGTELLRSLDIFFRNDAQVAKTATALFVHNHTLAYRLKRVEELTGRQLRSLQDQTELWLALQAMRITRGPATGE
jgi:purine catabolism regulator